MILTKSTIFLQDSAGSTPWSHPMPRVFRRFHPLSTPSGPATGFSNGLQRKSKIPSNMKKLNYALVLSVLCFGVSATARASLALNIDSSTKEYFFTGSDTGTASYYDPTGDFRLSWTFSWAGTPESSSTVNLASGALQFSAGTFNVGRVGAGYGSGGYHSTDVYLRFHDDPGTFTVAGTGVRTSYGSIAPELQSVLETATDPMDLVFGSGFSPVRPVQFQAVPEVASTFPILALISSGLMLRKRTKRLC